MSTLICVVGTIATDPKLHRSESSIPVCSFRLASNERRYDREQGRWIDGATNWFSVSAFRGLAEHAGESFAKGDRVLVSGRVRTREWSREDRSGTVLEIEADALGHDLRWGVSSFSKRFGGGATDDAGAGRSAGAEAAEADARAEAETGDTESGDDLMPQAA